MCLGNSNGCSPISPSPVLKTGDLSAAIVSFVSAETPTRPGAFSSLLDAGFFVIATAAWLVSLPVLSLLVAAYVLIEKIQRRLHG